MVKRQERILELTGKGITPDELCRKLRIPSTKLKDEIALLQNAGHNIIRQIYYNGSQKYLLQKGSPNYYQEILGIPNDDIFRALIASDYHIGSTKENIKYIEILYEYALKNGIHIILNAGDLIEGFLNAHIHSTYPEQIAYLLENHPFESGIINIIVLGNHDEDLIRNTGIDLSKVLNRERNDFLSLGYGIQRIGICKEEIVMCHIANKIRNLHTKLAVTGHGHRYQFKIDHGHPTIFAPSLSDDRKDGHSPGFIDSQIVIKEGKFSKISCDHYEIKKSKIEIKSHQSFDYETSYIEPDPKKTLVLSRFH